MNGRTETLTERVRMGLNRLPEDKVSEVLDFVEFLVLRHARPEDTPCPQRSYHAVVTDPKDALMEDPRALRTLYAEFAKEDRQLAQIGLAHYAQMLRQEENLP